MCTGPLVEALDFMPDSTPGVGFARVDRPGDASDAGLFAPLETGEAVVAREGPGELLTADLAGTDTLGVAGDAGADVTSAAFC